MCIRDRIPGGQKAKCIADSKRYDEVNSQVGEALKGKDVNKVLKLVPSYLKEIREAFADCFSLENNEQVKELVNQPEAKQITLAEAVDCKALDEEITTNLIAYIDSVKKRLPKEEVQKKFRAYRVSMNAYHTEGCRRNAQKKQSAQ
eukprot:TRINITY_DN0_c1280_g1_i1.p1 TRINITY_DN0_c1280_g1~~TRINITY_DN0_c1280_g1_i1.p1  ORF type:complete len:146 (+),score=61.96 TRINITY_DN0_c1280_g1_i1:1-438(+)